MRVTPRDRKILVKLAAARWLATRQVAALCFPGVSLEMARRRLRLLARARYVRSVRANAMAEALHALAPGGRALIGAHAWQAPPALERLPPKNLEHFLGVNDIRVAVERSAARDRIGLEFFFASWELQRQGWTQPVIPDAIAAFTGFGRTLVFEYDRGEEAPGYVVRTKYLAYARGIEGLPFPLIVTVADSIARLERLRRALADQVGSDGFVFVTRDELRSDWSAQALVG